MITYVCGGFFTSPAAVLVNTVNTVGVMGKGIAKEFKTIYPAMFEIYQQVCERGEFQIGSLLFYRSEHKSVLNFPTKRHWKAKSRIADIEVGLAAFVDRYQELSISSIAFPQLGCGNGELDWESQVRPLMEQYLGNLPIEIYIHIYDGAREFTEHRNIAEMKRWLLKEPSALGFVEVWENLADLLTRELRIDEWVVTMADEQALHFETRDKSIAVAREDLLDFWQQLRSYGLFSVDDIPSVYGEIAAPLLTLFTQLPYIGEAEFITIQAARGEAISKGFEHSSSKGVRLLPWKQDVEQAKRLPLFDELSVA